MRLKNMYLTCKKCLKYLDEFNVSENKNPQGQTAAYIVGDIEGYNDMEQALKQFGMFDNLLKILNNARGNSLRSDMDTIYPSSIDSFNIALNNLTHKVSAIVELGDAVGFSEFEQGFDIKLPSNMSLEELSICLKEIDMAISQCPYLNDANETIKFNNADVGSFWLEFIVICTGTTTVLLNLGKIVDKAVKIASHLKIIKMQNEQARKLNIENDLAEAMVTGFNEMTDKLIEQCADELQNEIKPLDNEDVERTKLSLKILGNWLSKGMEIYSCIESSQEVKDYFPTQEQQEYLTEATKLLSESKSATN